MMDSTAKKRKRRKNDMDQAGRKHPAFLYIELFKRRQKDLNLQSLSGSPVFGTGPVPLRHVSILNAAGRSRTCSPIWDHLLSRQTQYHCGTTAYVWDGMGSNHHFLCFKQMFAPCKLPSRTQCAGFEPAGRVNRSTD